MFEEVDECRGFVLHSDIEEHQRESVGESRLSIEPNENGVFQSGANKTRERLKRETGKCYSVT